MNSEVERLEHLLVAEIRPGDVLVYTTTGRLHDSAMAGIKEAMATAFPGHKAVVLCGGAELGIVRPLNDGAA